jgi:hypothetical protein
MMSDQIIDVAIHLYNRDSGVVNIGDLADPFILEFLLKLSIDLRKDWLRIVLLTLSLVDRVYYNEIYVRPRQAQLSGMRSVHLDLAVGQCLFDHSRYVFD